MKLLCRDAIVSWLWILRMVAIAMFVTSHVWRQLLLVTRSWSNLSENIKFTHCFFVIIVQNNIFSDDLILNNETFDVYGLLLLNTQLSAAC